MNYDSQWYNLPAQQKFIKILKSRFVANEKKQ
jgi:hypothetical protein